MTAPLIPARLLRAAGLALPLLLAACATKPPAAAPAAGAKPDAKAAAKIDPAQRALQNAQKDLDRLRGQTELAALVPQEIADADAALRIAQSPSSEPVLAAHQRYMAEKRVQLARSRAEALESVNRLQALAGNSGDERLVAAANAILPSPTLSPPPKLPKPPAPPKLPRGSAPPPAEASTPVVPPTPAPAPPADSTVAEAPLPIIGSGTPAPATPTPSVPATPPAPSLTPTADAPAPMPAPVETPAAAPPPAPSLPPMSDFAATGAVTLPASLFGADGSLPADAGQGPLQALVSAAKASGDVIEVDGLSGDDGNNNASLSLAQRRAEAVKRLLVELGMDAAKVSASAMGEYFPPGTPVEPRAPRVEVRIQ